MNSRTLQKNAFRRGGKFRKAWRGSLLLSLMFLLVIFACSTDRAFAEGFDLGGSGNATDPYRIASADDLEKLRLEVASGNSLVGKHVALEADIILPEDWSGLGSLKEGTANPDRGKNINPFSGTFDGQGHMVTTADGGKPLFGYVREATIENISIAGRNIDGNGLIDKYVVDYGETGNSAHATWTARVDHVIIKAGSSIKGSGIVGGYAAGANTVSISECIVEDGVVIGYEGTREKIGSFGGDFNGRIQNCYSGATVKGTNFVGGIMGCKGNSMSDTSITGCTFAGEVIASGTYAGGMAGASYGGTGWGIDTAPNAPALTVKNCLCTGQITAADVAGGIIGYDTTLQCWENGKAFVQSNIFAGNISATDGTCVGGIAGRYRGLDRYNIIEGNYYAENCGTNRGIGGAVYVDTSCTTHETQYGENYINTYSENGTVPVIPGVNDTYIGNLRANHNRTDDPLGADAESLAKPVTAQQLADGTVTDWLNDGPGSLGNWIQEGEIPTMRGVVFLTGMKLEDGYQCVYEVGDELDKSSLNFCLSWSDGNTEDITGEDERLTIAGFDSSSRQICEVTASIGSVSTRFLIKVRNPGSEMINVYFTLLGDSRHGADSGSGPHTRAGGNLQTWIEKTLMTVEADSTVKDVIIEALAEKGIAIEGNNSDQYGSYYISGVQMPGTNEILYEKENGPNSGWMYAVNDEEPGVGVGSVLVNNRDEIILFYTDDYTKEKSARPYDGDDEEPEQGDAATKTIVKGKTYGVAKSNYKVTRVATKKTAGTVTLTRAVNKKKVVVPATVKLADKRTYRVTVIGAKAFKGKKIRTVTIGARVTKICSKAFAGSKATTMVLKTKSLKKKKVKGCLKASKIKVIRVKVGKTGVNKKYVKKYKKIFTKKNAGKKVKIKR